MISSISSVVRIFFILVHFLRVILVHFTLSSLVSCTVSPEVRVLPNASTVREFDIGIIGYDYSVLFLT